MKKLFVGNLPFKTNEAELREMFSKCGEISDIAVIMDREKGTSKGFGFVTMANDAEADAAIEMWNGKEVDGRPLTVNEARPKSEDNRSRGGFRR